MKLEFCTMANVPHGSRLGDLQRLFSYLPAKRRPQLAGLSALMLLGAVAELATIGSVLPFLALLAHPEGMARYPAAVRLLEAVGLTSHTDQLLGATVLFAATAVTAAVVRVFLLWASVRYTHGLGVDLAVQVYRNILYQPYSYHVARNSSETLAAVDKVRTVVFSVFTPLVQGAVSTVIAAALLAGLFVVDALTATLAGAALCGLYVLMSTVARVRLRRNGRLYADSEGKRVQAVQEGLGGIRDVLIDGTQEHYISRYAEFVRIQRRAMVGNSFMSTAPRYVIEVAGMVMIGALSLFLSQRPGGLPAAIPVLGALAIGAQRLLPQLQIIYQGWSSASGQWASLQDVLKLLSQPMLQDTTDRAQDTLTLARGISLENVTFRYTSDGPDILRGVTVHIPRGSQIGVIGKTGGGKSTLMDLVMGLLEPTGGAIRIGSASLTRGNVRAWHRHIAHVPQAIYLADTTVAENIAFGIHPAAIDMARVQKAAEAAQLASYIETLPDQYRAAVGERGVRLSGGQRQRIGIARALYKEAEVLVLDEATSALDHETELAVIESIRKMRGDITVIMVAHRLSTLRQCDFVCRVDKGRVEIEAQDRDQPALAR